MKNHFRIFTCFAVVLWITSISVSTVFAFSSGPPDGRTGSPADNFKTCKDIGCHNSFALNSGKALFSISAPSDYTLGEVVPITISFSNSNTAKHGFELSALDANNKHVGTFDNVDNKTQSSGGNYIKHTSVGSSQSGRASWNIQWTAPSSTVRNPVTFYAAGNEANGDGTHDEDHIYTITREISQRAVTPTPTPTGAETPSPIPTVTPAVCETESMSASPSTLELNREESVQVVVTLIPADGCPPEEGGIVKAKVNKIGKKRITVLPQGATTNAKGEATFTITAKNKAGNARVQFRYEDLKTTVTVKVVK